MVYVDNQKEIEMSRTEMVAKFEQIRDLVSGEGVGVKWTLETGKVVMKKNGTVKMYFSLRELRTLDRDIESVKRNCMKVLGENVVFSKSDQFNAFRYQYYVICTFTP